MSEQSLRVEEVKHTLRPAVPPVTLQQKCISLLNTSIINPDHNQDIHPNTTIVSTSSSTKTISPLSSPTLTTSAARIAQTLPSVSAAITPTLVTPTIRSPGIKVTPPTLTSSVSGQRLRIEDSHYAESTPRDSLNTKEALSAEVRSDSNLQTTFTISEEASKGNRGKELDRKTGESGTQVSDISPKRDVMQFFHEQEKNLQKHFLALPQRGHKKQRPLMPKLQQSAGLEHLDNLIRLMEQLTSLKDENSMLRKRCDYLESTKTLLQAKKNLISEDRSTSLGFMTPQSNPKHHHHHYRHKKDNILSHYGNGLNRPMISNSEAFEYLDVADSSSDQEEKKPKPSKLSRSFSTGSLEVPSERSIDVGEVESKSRIKGQSRRSSSKQKSKGSKWSRVKKALTGQKIYEDLGTNMKPFRDLRPSSNALYSTNGITNSPRSFRSPASKITKTGRGNSPEVIRDKSPLAGASSVMTESTSHRHQVEEDPDLTSEIWMGPPDWWEEYESRKESGDTSTNSDASSIIEITTMYLGSKKDTVISSVAPIDTTLSVTKTAHGKYLSIDDAIPYRQPNSGLSVKEAMEHGAFVKDFSTSVESAKLLHKSSSCKSGDLDIPKISEYAQLEKKSHRSAWGRVKDIIHTRKDSIKKKLKRDKPVLESDEARDVSMEESLKEHKRPDVFSEVLLNRHTPKSSPLAIRQQKTKRTSESAASRASMHNPGSSPGNVDVAALLAGKISEEFSKKMFEWEQQRRKKPLSYARDESDLGSLDISMMPREFPVRTIDLRDFKGTVPDSASEWVNTEESNTSMEVLGAPSISAEEARRRMVGSFSRKVQDSERLKYKGSSGHVREFSPVNVRKESKKQKSKMSREEKEKMERPTERDMQKANKEQVTSEKEKRKAEKQRERALECEEKLERLKGRVHQTESEASLQYSTHISLTGGRQDSLFEQEEVRNRLERRSTSEAGKKVSRSLTPQPYSDSPEDTSPADTSSEASLEDDTCSNATQKCLTKSNIASLERANTQLLENLHKKEIEYAAVQEEVQKVNEKLAKVREEHAAEMERFHSDLSKGRFAGPVKLEVGELEVTVGELEEKIKMMENFGEKLASSMESAAVGKWQSIEAEETVHKQLVELIEQMRCMLIQASQSAEHSQKTLALSNFETLYAQAMKLQVQMNNLRLSHLERNREIMVIKRQLLLQEVNNLLLQADITRRETELYQFQEAKTWASLKRWNTFGGSERQRPQVQMEIQPSSTLASASFKAGPQKEVKSKQEEMIHPSATCSSISKPASPMAIGVAGDSLAAPSTTDQLHSYHEAGNEKPKDHKEPHPDPILGRRDRHVSPLLKTYLAQQQDENTRTLCGNQEITTSPQLPILANQVQQRKYLHEQSSMTSPVTSKVPIVSSKELMKENSENAKKVLRASTSPTKKTSVVEVGANSATYSRSEFTTLSDSVPLHKQIAELIRVKRKVEKETSIIKRAGSKGSSPSLSHGKEARHSISTETSDQLIPRQQSLQKGGFAESSPSDDDYYPVSSVLECSDNSFNVEQIEIISDSALGDEKVLSIKPPFAERSGRQLPSTGDQSKAGSKSPRSSVGKGVLLRQQKEERNSEPRENCAISPRGSPASARGKPPLPGQISPARISPSASPVTKKGHRSKSVGDMNRGAPESITSEPLQEVINKFEKRATVCETVDRPSYLRKSPSPTLHLPRVGLVNRVRRIKPAAELLEESQRYRSGHSIYATRILQRYLHKDDQKSDLTKTVPSKEIESGTDVQRLSRDKTPARNTGSSRTSSDLPLKRTDSFTTQTEFVTDFARECSSTRGSGTRESFTLLDDLTNESQLKQLSQKFNGQLQSGSPERKLSHHSCGKEHDIPLTLQTSSPLLISEDGSSQKSDSAVKPTSHKSIPTLGLATSDKRNVNAAAAYIMSGVDTGKPPRYSNDVKSQPASTPSSPALREQGGKSWYRRKSEKMSREKSDSGRFLSCPFPARRKGDLNQKETIRVLCEQSLSFDLGLSQYSQQLQAREPISGSRHAHSRDPNESLHSEVASAVAATANHPHNGTSSATTPSANAPLSITAGATVTENTRPLSCSSVTEDTRPLSFSSVTDDTRPLSCSSDREVIPSSPTMSQKTKSKTILDSGWLKKSKNFFKVSK